MVRCPSIGTTQKKFPSILHKPPNTCDINISTPENWTMTRHDAAVEPLFDLVPAATSFNLWLQPEFKPICLTLYLLARYSDIVSGIIELFRCYPNLLVNPDKQLRELLQLLKDSQQGSQEQKRLKNQLCKLLRDLPGSRKYREPDANIDFDGALHEAYAGFFTTLPNFLRGIDLDNIADDVLRTRVVRRFNQIIQNKVCNQYRKLERQPFTFSLDAPNKSNKTGEEFDSEGMADDTTEIGIEQLIEREQAKNQQRIGLQLWQYIEDDPDEKLRNCYPDNKPEANCQVLARRLLLKNPPDSLSVIAKELDINYQTLNSHWNNRNRKDLKGLPLLKKIALEFGYQPEESK